jgi:hypothetical protein
MPHDSKSDSSHSYNELLKATESGHLSLRPAASDANYYRPATPGDDPHKDTAQDILNPPCLPGEVHMRYGDRQTAENGAPVIARGAACRGREGEWRSVAPK